VGDFPGTPVEDVNAALAFPKSMRVLTALRYGNGRLFRTVHGREMPHWALVFANSCGQLFLKDLRSDPRVTAVIPGTGDPGHMADNQARCAARSPTPTNVVKWSSTSKHSNR
jgi:hypothetical protein